MTLRLNHASLDCRWQAVVSASSFDLLITFATSAGRPPVAIQFVSTGGFYGAERTLLELAMFLRDQGWDCRIVAQSPFGELGSAPNRTSSYRLRASGHPKARLTNSPPEVPTARR
jgi:hypothetical protein